MLIDVADILLSMLVPLGIAAVVVQSSIYDVPGGYRAVMFDRFSGVKNEVGSPLIIFADTGLMNDTGLP
jgi:prohibitin 1